ncbi:MAG: right-handed parallel beta-helix repeat-containing protein [Phycisphaerales bacterium]|nr:right-handed parallel beta-helix repeat-containing protein [Phycisphaerales bacterium]
MHHPTPSDTPIPAARAPERRAMLAGLGGLAAGAMLAGGRAAQAGPLDPPAGPVTSTGKTLTEVEPRIAVNAANTPGDADNQYRISQPGSYYLTGNITGASGKTCIYIASSRVTLDLNGFALNGVAGAVNGVRANANHGVAIRNGSVLDFATGIDAQETNGSRLDNLCATSNNIGFKIGLTAVVTDCTSVDNASTGFTVFSTSSLTRCSSRGGGSRGFSIGRGCTLTDCNAWTAATGFFIDGESVLEKCSSRENSSHGFNIQESCVLIGCNAYDNGGIGFFATARSRMTNCVSRANAYGFSMVEANALVECTSASNTTDGLFIDGNANTVERSTFHENTRYGINLTSGVGNTIDGNLITYNGDTGLRVNASNNLATRNRARGNGANYTFVSGADYGVVLTNPGAGFTSSAAWANFAY